MKRYEEVNFAGLAEQDCCCGVVRRAFADSQDGPASVHLLDLADEPTSHYHRKTTEIYVVLEGEGHLELDGEMVPVSHIGFITDTVCMPGKLLGEIRGSGENLIDGTTQAGFL